MTLPVLWFFEYIRAALSVAAVAPPALFCILKQFDVPADGGIWSYSDMVLWSFKRHIANEAKRLI